MKRNQKSKILWIIGLFVLLWIEPFRAMGQEGKNEKELTKDQYRLLQLAYHEYEHKGLKLYHETVGDPSWVDRLLELKSEEYIFLHKFENEELPKALDKLPGLSSQLSTKSLDKSELGPKVRMRNKRKDEVTIYMAEPIIVGNYAFVLVRKPKNEAVYIYTLDAESEWSIETLAHLSYVIECYGG